MRIKLFLFILVFFNEASIYSQQWLWSKQFSSSASTGIGAIELDNSNNVYSTGGFTATINIGASSVLNRIGAFNNFYIVKYNPSGAYLWHRQLAGTGDINRGNLVLDSEDSLVFCAFYVGRCDSLPGLPQTYKSTTSNVLLAKYGSNGHLGWTKRAAWGPADIKSQHMTVDPMNNIYITGFSTDTIYFGGGNKIISTSNRVINFIAKYSPEGDFISVTKISYRSTTTSTNKFVEISAPNEDEVYVGGFFSDSVSAGTIKLYSGGTSTENALLIKINGSGSVDWMRMGGSVTGNDRCNGVTTDIYGNVYITGYISGTAKFDSTGNGSQDSSPISSNGSNFDMMIAKYNKNGTLQWKRRNGSTGADIGYDVFISSTLLMYTGYYSGSVTFNNVTLNSGSTSNLNTGFFIYDVDGNPVTARDIQGNGADRAENITYDNNGNTYIGGYFLSTDLTIGSSVYNSGGTQDGFIAKYQNPFSVTFSKSQNLSCNGDTDGLLIATPFFGAPPYSYSWSPNVANFNDSLAYNLPAGTYTVTVTDSRDSVAVASYTITQPPAINITSAQTSVNCHPDNGLATNGSVNITASGGTGAYNYFWTAISGSGVVPTSEDQTTLTEGTYQVIVRDENLCEAAKSFIINGPSKIIFDNSIVTNASGGLSDGAVNLNVAGGNNPPAYTSFGWSNGVLTEDISAIPGGNYSVVVTDSKNCQADTLFLVNDVSLLQVAVTSITDVDCWGNSTGSATAAVYNGSGDYTYSWRNISDVEVGTLPTLNNVPAGSYYIFITDNISSETTQTPLFSISQPNQALSTAISGANVKCYATSTGIVNLIISGGTLPYRFLWSNGSTSEDLVNIPANFYTVAVTDTNNCTANNNMNITEPAPLDINISIDQSILCYSDQTGRLTATATGGTGTKTYLWDDPGNQTAQTATSLFGGNYNVVATDLNGCIITDNIVLYEPDSISLVPVIQQTSCFGATDGSIVLNVSGGSPAFNYVWSNGQFTKNISALVAGTYTVDITDNNSCATNASFVVGQPSEVSFSSIVPTDATCYGASDGQLDISAQGGSGSYQYSIDGGTNFFVSSSFGALNAGNFSLVLRDGNNCISSDSTISISQPSEVTFQNIISNTPSCKGMNDASIEITPSGGSGGPYEFSIDDGGNFSVNPIFTGIPAGTYTLVISDINNCISSDSILNITSPVDVVFQDINLISPTCIGTSDAEIEIIAGGGAGAPYQYSIDNGSNYVSNGLFNNLSARNYTLKLMDANNCESSDSIITISNPIATAITSETATDVSCIGSGNGSIEIIVLGTAADFEYSIDNGLNFYANNGLFNNLDTGSYQVMVKDLTDCRQSGSLLTINEPDSVVIDTLSVVHADGEINGAVYTLAQGGSSPFTYVLTGGDADSLTNPNGEFTNLLPGNYIAYAMDNNSCKSDTIQITILNSFSELEIFDAFSPNEDGINDVWNILNISRYPDCSVTIFNTWGNKVFSSKGYSVPWDGKYNDQYLPAGTYYYLIDPGDGSDALAGPVSIVR